MTKLLEIVGSDNLERTITVTINGNRYDYYFHNSAEDSLRALKYQMIFSQGKAIQWLKQHSWKCIRISNS